MELTLTSPASTFATPKTSFAAGPSEPHQPPFQLAFDKRSSNGSSALEQKFGDRKI
jgi:hypothetical protein